MELSKYIGSKIRYYRELKNLTQDELAEQLGTTRQSVSRYENGERKANQDILFELADIFKISINNFFPPVENIPSIETIYNQLEDSRQKEVYDFAEYHLKEQENAAANSNKVIPLKEKKKETKDYLKVVAAHIDDDATEEELDEIKAFIDSLTKED